MSPELCRELFLRGAQGADVAVVEGKFESAVDRGQAGGRLEPLCRWLNLPRLVVLDASRVDELGASERPEQIDGLLLDRIADSSHLARLATDLEALWGVPVLGALERLPGLRAQLQALPPGESPPRALYHELGNQLVRYWRPDRVWKLAKRRPFPAGSGGSFCLGAAPAKLSVATAYDEAFHCYFPDTLDLLELQGASMVDFSPLRDEILPPRTDVVYLGCGHPERHAATLSENHCMKAALRSHLATGGRIYAEGGGAAYLCQQMEAPGGELKRMVGIVPGVARLRRAPSGPVPVEVTLVRPNWLGNRGTRLRGYRNPRWDVQPLGHLLGYLAEEKHRYDLVGNFRAIGSLLHVHFAAQWKLLQRFFCPQDPESDFRDPWAAS
jgi:cobyrinic acid a,c-diamide synthase